MNPQEIIRRALDRGPHCFRAYVRGRGYINDGSAAFDRADYLAQYHRAAESEIDNMRHATGYAERGYDRPDHGVLFANWNVLPAGIQDDLEVAGFSCEWSDEWDVCEDCDRAFRTSADSYVWTPAGTYIEENRSSWPYDVAGPLCLDCLQDAAQSTRESEREELETAGE